MTAIALDTLSRRLAGTRLAAESNLIRGRWLENDARLSVQRANIRVDQPWAQVMRSTKPSSRPGPPLSV